MSKPEEITLAVRKERAWELLSYWRELGLSNAQFDVIKYVEDLETEIARLKTEKEAYAKEAFEAGHLLEGEPGDMSFVFPFYSQWQRSREK